MNYPGPSSLRCHRRGVAVVLLSAGGLLAAGCSSHGPGPPHPVLGGFSGCSQLDAVPRVTQKGVASLILVFQPGTTASALDAVANSLLPSSRQGVVAAIQSGVAGVEQPICDPAQIRVDYRTAMSASNLARLRAGLLSEPGVIGVQPG